MTRQAARVWVIDGIEDGVARIEEDGKRMLTVPRDLLPAGAREGQLLSVEYDNASPMRVSLVVTIDEKGTAAALARSHATTQAASAASRKRDPGGDVAL